LLRHIPAANGLPLCRAAAWNGWTRPPSYIVRLRTQLISSPAPSQLRCLSPSRSDLSATHVRSVRGRPRSKPAVRQAQLRRQVAPISTASASTSHLRLNASHLLSGQDRACDRKPACRSSPSPAQQQAAVAAANHCNTRRSHQMTPTGVPSQAAARRVAATTPMVLLSRTACSSVDARPSSALFSIASHSCCNGRRRCASGSLSCWSL
jgi:hypothetical protein